MRFSEITEGRSAPLYHYMELTKAIDVFDHDVMEARWAHVIPQIGRVVGNSFSRNAFLHFPRPIRLVVSQARLAQTNRIIPLDGERIFYHTGEGQYGANVAARKLQPSKISDRTSNKFHLNTWAEEFVVGDIKSLHRYIEQIEYRFVNGMGSWDMMDLRECVTKYSTKYKVTVVIDPRIDEHIGLTKKRWDEEE